MYIVAIHDVSDPEKFWGTIQTATIPEGIRLHSTLPNAGGTRAVCLWEGESEEQIKKLVEGTVGQASENEYFEVKADNAMGLPA